MSTLTQFVGIGTSLTVTNLKACITLTVDSTAPLGSRPKRTGGFLICKAASKLWIVSPRCTEVSRSWTNRNDAITLANTCTSYTGWFIPTPTQLQNPGYLCRTYWDLFSPDKYWSDSALFVGLGVDFSNGADFCESAFISNRVRSFRCVTY